MCCQPEDYDYFFLLSVMIHVNYYLFLLGYSCFKMLCSFLLYNEMNQLFVYIYPLPLAAALYNHPSRSSQSMELSSLSYTYSRFPLAIRLKESPHLFWGGGYIYWLKTIASLFQQRPFRRQNSFGKTE